MKTRLQTLDRLRALYGVVTHIHEVSLMRATAAVRDVEQRIVGQRDLAVRSSVEGLAALREADKPGWMIQESQRELSGQNAEWLGRVREERAVSMQTAAVLYRANRLQLEQMRSVLKGLQSAAEQERARREQREADDRFLSQQRWREMQKAELNRAIRMKQG